MLPIRIKACSESDLRMLGNLARNIQRVLPVTQADIDAAAALGKGWVVWKVFEVTDPLDNLRGGTQLVIKQNSIQPGQNVRRVLIVQDPGGQMVVIGPAPSPLSLPNAIANSLQYVKAFGGTMQGVPDGYTLLNGVTNGASTYVDTGITPTVDDVEIEIRAKPTTNSWYILQSRASGGTVWGVSGSSTGDTITVGWAGIGGLCQSSITRDPTHTYYVKATMNNGTATLYVKDETDNTEDTTTATYTSAVPTLPFWLFGNQQGDRVNSGNTVYMARIKVGGVTVMDYVPALNPSMVVGFYDKATGNFKVSSEGTLTADQTIVPTPDAPMDIVSNNGVLKARHQSGLPLGYTLLDYIESTGTQYIDTGITPTTTNNTKVEFELQLTVITSGDAQSIGTNNNIHLRSDTLFFRPNARTLDVPLDTAKHRVVLQQTSVGRAYQFDNLSGTGSANEELANFHLFRMNGVSITRYGYYRLYYTKIWDNNTLVRDFVPCKNASNVVGMYDLVNGVFYQNAGTGDFVAGNVIDDVEIYTDGTVETIKDSLNNTATAEMLLKIGNYQDEQEILSGVVTRNVGVKVLDGTEEIWGSVSQTPDYVSILSNCYTVVIPLGDGSINNRRVYCTHLTSSDTLPDANARQGYALLGNGGSSTAQPLTNKYAVGLGLTTSFPTIAGLKQWLAAQYAAGTPVIIVYPLTDSITETVTGQTLQVQAGNNTLEITQASLNNLHLECEYKKNA